MNELMSEKERKTRCDLRNELYGYRQELIKMFLENKEQLKDTFIEFCKRAGNDCVSQYVFNEIWVTRDCLFDLLGSFLFSPPDCAPEHFFIHDSVAAQGIRKRMVDLENFLKKIPGIELPPRPEKVNAWLNEKEE